MTPPSTGEFGMVKGQFPARFVENVVGVCGEAGRRWIESLPLMISLFEEKWRVRVGPHFSNLSYNYVAPAVRDDGLATVLKIALPAADAEARGERRYLRAMAGRGTIEIIEQDDDRDAFLMRRSSPGEDLQTAFAKAPRGAVEAAIQLLMTLTASPTVDSESFVSLAEWAAELKKVSHYDFPPSYAAKASAIFNLEKKSARTLIHGDYHHENILSSGNSFVAIDPKGIIGEVKYDIAVFLNNHYGWLRDRPDARTETHLAAARFAEVFGYSRAEILEWAFAQKVLAAFWTCTEGNDRWRRQLTSADIWDL